VQAGQQAGLPLNPDFNGASQEGVGPYQVTHRNGERCSAAKAYLTPNLQRPNLQVITQAFSTRILFEGKRSVGVEYRQGGSTRQVRAKREVLLCAGALQSPQLLMLSGVGPGGHLQKHGITTLHDLPGVGQHLHDHVDVVSIFDAPQLKDLFGLSFTGAWRSLGAMLEWRRQRSGPLTTNFAECGGFLKSRPELSRPDLQLHFVVGKLLDHGRKTVFGHGYSSHVCLLHPASRGSVQLAGKEPETAPRIDPNFFGAPEDMERMVLGFKHMRHVLSQPALASLGAREFASSADARSDEQIRQFIRQYADTIYHPVGSCRMGSGPLDVVDAELRVHGLQGLRVVDASIMPSIVSGNTNAPVIAIAEKAADLIKAAARMA
jgi:choline dehydrogenase-like flavoprotein